VAAREVRAAVLRLGAHVRSALALRGARGVCVTLPADEGEHLTRVLRLKPGDALRVFNGHGSEFDGFVDDAGKAGVRVRIHSVAEAAPETRVAITLAQAVLKGDKMDEVVRDAVMLGVAAIQPMVTARTETTVGAESLSPFS